MPATIRKTDLHTLATTAGRVAKYGTTECKYCDRTPEGHDHIGAFAPGETSHTFIPVNWHGEDL